MRQVFGRDSGGYRSILRSSAITGGSQLLTLIIGVFRTKCTAVLLGPEGVGLIAIYQAITSIVSEIVGLGVNSSAVREIARCRADGDVEEVSRIARTLQRVCWLTGFAGLVIMAVNASWISSCCFGSAQYSGQIALLGVVVLLTNIAMAQSAILQGCQKVVDLAKLNIVSASVGVLLVIPVYYVFNIRGVAVGLVCGALVQVLAAFLFSMRVSLAKVTVSWAVVWNRSRTLVAFGIAMLVSGLVSAGSSYSIRQLVIAHGGFEAAGVHSAAFSLSGLFVQFILQAMGLDFYPRLTAVAGDHNRMRGMVNEQTEVGMLLAFPGLLLTLGFASIVIDVFYTAEFSGASSLLVWFVMGCFGKILSWPLGFSLLAGGHARIYASIESCFHCLHVGLVWVSLASIGLVGVAMSYVALYVLYTLAMLFVSFRICGFCWSRKVFLNLCWMVPVAIAVSLDFGGVGRLSDRVFDCVSVFVAVVVCLSQLLRNSELRLIAGLRRQ